MWQPGQSGAAAAQLLCSDTVATCDVMIGVISLTEKDLAIFLCIVSSRYSRVALAPITRFSRDACPVVNRRETDAAGRAPTHVCRCLSRSCIACPALAVL